MKILDDSSVYFPRTPAALQQSPGYARAIAEMGAHVERFIIQDGNQPVARFQLLRRKMGPLKLFWVPRGPVWAPGVSIAQRDHAMALLTRAIGEKGLWLLSPEDAADLRRLRHHVLMTPQHVAELDLRPRPDVRLAAQHGKWRNRLRRAERADVCITHRPFDITRDLDVLQLEGQQRATRRYKALPPEFVMAWARVNPKQTRLFTVRSGKTALAHMLILLHRPVATYHLGWTGEAGRAVSAHHLALWHATTWLSDNGYTRFDLGSVDTENTPGLARFKIGSGATIRALGPSALLLPRITLSRRIRHAAA